MTRRPRPFGHRAARRDLAGISAQLDEVNGRMRVIEATCDEAVGRLTVLTADHAGGYETEHFALVSAGARERLEMATAGASDPGLN